MRQRWVASAVAVALLVPAAAPAAFGGAREVVADYFSNGQLDGSYSIVELRGALAFAQRHQSGGSQYAAFADAVNQAITDVLVGSGEAAQRQLTASRSRTSISPAPAPAPQEPPSNLPGPPAGPPPTSVPLAMPMMAIGAAVLLLAGVGASVYRRMRR